MTWPEICDELVKRWPDAFIPYFVYRLPRLHLRADGYWILPDSTHDINRICTAIGAVVWSYPEIQYTPRKRMWHGAYLNQIPRDVMVYPTRAEAELAALGAWLEATR